MASAIDDTRPATTHAYTADVRANFAAAKSEIQSLQADTAAVFTAADDAYNLANVAQATAESAVAAAAAALAAANEADDTADAAAALAGQYIANQSSQTSAQIVLRASIIGSNYFWVTFIAKMTSIPVVTLSAVGYGAGASALAALNVSSSGFEAAFNSTEVGGYVGFGYTATV